MPPYTIRANALVVSGTAMKTAWCSGCSTVRKSIASCVDTILCSVSTIPIKIQEALCPS